MKHCLVNSSAVVLALSIATSATAEQPNSEPTPLSSFVEGEVQFEAHPELTNVYRYLTPGSDLKDFDKVQLAPIEIGIHADSPYRGINADDMRLLSERFVEAMQNELEPDYPLVSRPGPGVAVIHFALSDVKLEKKKRGLLGYTPIGFVATAAMDAAGERVSLLDAKLEAEVLDGASGDRVGVLVDFSFDHDGESNDWSDIEDRLRFYAKRFRNLLDLAQGRDPKNSASEMPPLL
jgi:hypothetical protein